MNGSDDQLKLVFPRDAEGVLHWLVFLVESLLDPGSDYSSAELAEFRPGCAALIELAEGERDFALEAYAALRVYLAVEPPGDRALSEAAAQRRAERRRQHAMVRATVQAELRFTIELARELAVGDGELPDLLKAAVLAAAVPAPPPVVPSPAPAASSPPAGAQLIELTARPRHRPPKPPL